MFTGIVEGVATIAAVEKRDGTAFFLDAPIASELAIGDSVAIDGVCLTVVEITGSRFQVFASRETLEITSLGGKDVGSLCNYERAMQIGDRLDGHMVYGHVDHQVALREVSHGEESHIFTFDLPVENSKYIVPKGSIAINGISLTVYEKGTDSFSVMIIPHTFSVTNFRILHAGDMVNIEYDVVAKYIENFTLPRQ